MKDRSKLLRAGSRNDDATGNNSIYWLVPYVPSITLCILHFLALLKFVSCLEHLALLLSTKVQYSISLYANVPNTFHHCFFLQALGAGAISLSNHDCCFYGCVFKQVFYGTQQPTNCYTSTIRHQA